MKRRDVRVFFVHIIHVKHVLGKATANEIGVRGKFRVLLYNIEIKQSQEYDNFLCVDKYQETVKNQLFNWG